jgi:hypothetical protein
VPHFKSFDQRKELATLSKNSVPGRQMIQLNHFVYRQFFVLAHVSFFSQAAGVRVRPLSFALLATSSITISLWF